MWCPLQLLKVFFPEAREAERRQLAEKCPPSIAPCSGLYDRLDLAAIRAVFDQCCPKNASFIPRSFHAHVRQLLGKLGFGDLTGEEQLQRSAFNQVDINGDDKV